MNKSRIITWSTIAALGLAMLPSAAVSQQTSLKQQLVGAWTLVSIIATDKAGNVHVGVGKASFKPEHIEDNARVVIEAVAKAKPNSLKGTYIHSCTLSATMSPGVRVDIREFTA